MSQPAEVRRAPSLLVRLAAFGDDATNLRLLGLIVLLVIVFRAVAGPSLFTGRALQAMGFQMPELGILSLAMMISLLSGGLDLAIIATADLSALAMGFVLTHSPALAGAGWLGWQVVALGAGLALATAIGLLNGWIIAYVGVSPILATLGTMTMVRGIAIGLTHGNVISGFPAWVVFLGNGTVMGIPAPLFVLAAVAIPLAVMLTRSPLGIAIAMIGSNQQATRFSGIDTRRVLMKVYVISSLLAAVAALVMMARFNSANATYGESYLLVTIVAAVLGGVDPLGGFGKVSGLILALIVLQLISSAFNQLSLSQFLTLAIWGATLIVVSGLPVIWRLVRRAG